MIITVECPHCHSTFPVDPAKVPAGGVKVRCSSCAGIFRVEKPAEDAPPPAPTEAPPAPTESAPPPAPTEAPPAPTESAPPPAPTEAPSAPAEASPPPSAEAPSISPAPPTPAPEDDAAEGPGDAGSDLHMDDQDDGSAGEWAGTEVADEPRPSPSVDWTWGEQEVEEPEDAPEPGFMEEARAEVEDPAPDFGGPHVDAPGSEMRPEVAPDPEMRVEPTLQPGPEVAPEPETGPELPAEAAPEPDEWVFETEDDPDPSSLEVERLDTVEEQRRSATRESFGQDDDPGAAASGPEVPPAPAPPADEAFVPAAEAPISEPPVEERTPEPPAAEVPVDEAPAEAPAPETPSLPKGFQFGRRDPEEKAKRLARVLVSDIITYNPERHARALENGTLHEDFEEEIRKSWTEYVDQVGREVAETTPYFTRALNDILARGRQVFED